MSEADLKLLSTALDFASKMVWPCLVAALFIAYRRQIPMVLARIASVKIGGSEFVFQQPSSEAPAAPADAKADKAQLGPDGFVSAREIRAMIMTSGLVSSTEVFLGEILIFRTPSQKTWIFATNVHFVVVLDDEDTRQSSRMIQSVFEKRRSLPLRFGTDQGAGLVAFAAEEGWWYYSLNMFSSPSSLAAAIRRLIG